MKLPPVRQEMHEDLKIAIPSSCPLIFASPPPPTKAIILSLPAYYSIARCRTKHDPAENNRYDRLRCRPRVRIPLAEAFAHQYHYI